MPVYPFYCDGCQLTWEEVTGSMRDAPKEAPCPECGALHGQDIASKRLRGNVSTRGNWTGGKVLTELMPGDPMRTVTNERDAVAALKARGVDPETRQIVDTEAYRCGERAAHAACKEIRKRNNREQKVIQEEYRARMRKPTISRPGLGKS